jgi:hypothetical protein
MTAGCVAYGVAIVARRDVIDIAWPDFERRAVLQEKALATGQVDADVVRFTPASLDNRAHVFRPAPTWLLDYAGDRRVADVDDLLDDPRKLHCFIGRVEALGSVLSHPSIMCICRAVAQPGSRAWRRGQGFGLLASGPKVFAPARSILGRDAGDADSALRAGRRLSGEGHPA